MSDPSHAIAELLQKDGRYSYEAYVFVFEALSYAQQALGMGADCPSAPTEPASCETEEPAGPQRHVTGQELCEAIRQLALHQYGYMAKTVLNSWGIHTTSDFGEIVFNLIRVGHMRRTQHDRREDFDNVYQFEAALEEAFRITLPK